MIFWPEVDCLQLGCTGNSTRRRWTHIADISVMLQTDGRSLSRLHGWKSGCLLHCQSLLPNAKADGFSQQLCPILLLYQSRAGDGVGHTYLSSEQKTTFYPYFYLPLFCRKTTFSKATKEFSTLWRLEPTGRVGTDSKTHAEMLQGAKM